MHKKRMKNQNGQMPFTIRMLVLLMVKALLLAENQKTNHKQESSIYLIPFS
jgi:hypothetical protein